MTATLTRCLDVIGSDRETYMIPAGTEVTVHHLTAARDAVVVDGRVYRSLASAVEAATL